LAAVPWLLSNGSTRVSALQVEAIFFCLVVFLGANVAWAAAMSPSEESAEPAPSDAEVDGEK
jgi:hypothetical protein